MKFEQYKDRAIITVHSDGPRGPQGIQGPKGDKGEKGDTGEVTQEEFDQQKDAINLKIAKVEDNLVAHKEDYMAEVGEINAQLADIANGTQGEYGTIILSDPAKRPNFNFTNRTFTIPAPNVEISWRNKVYNVGANDVVLDINIAAVGSRGFIGFNTSNNTLDVYKTSDLATLSDSIILLGHFNIATKIAYLNGLYTIDGLSPYYKQTDIMYRHIQFAPQGSGLPILDYPNKRMVFPPAPVDMAVRIDGVLYAGLIPSNQEFVVDLSTINYSGTSLHGILINPVDKSWLVVPHTDVPNYKSTHIIFGMLRFIFGQTYVLVSPYPYIVDGKLYGMSSPTPVAVTSNSLDANVKAVAHRGYSSTHPENTLPAYEEAKAKGFSYVEADIEWTSDGVPVLLHDATIDRTSDGAGNINTLTLSQVKTYDFGSWKSATFAGTKIPTFEEFILLCKKINLHPYIELKGTISSAQALILTDIVKKLGMINNVSWISFQLASLTEILTLVPTARVGFVTWETTVEPSSSVLALKAEGKNIFMDVEHTVTPLSAIQAYLMADIPVEVHTINNSADLINAVNKGVSGITTDILNIAEILSQ